MSKLKDEFDYFLQNKEEFLIKHAGKYIVLKDRQVIGVYDDQLEATEETVKNHELGSFLVQHVVPGKEELQSTSSTWGKYPKIYSLGHQRVKDILNFSGITTGPLGGPQIFF